jgi:CBS domain-containing protein
LPVCDGDQVPGMIADRDNTCATAAGGEPTATRVRDVMTAVVITGFEDTV